MKIPITLIIAPLILLMNCPIQADSLKRHEVRGRLLDADTGAPIRYANIFLANTTRGTTSLKDGRFTIKRVPPGRYELVVSMMGYAPQRRSVTLSSKSVSLRTIHIKQKAIMGETVTITVERNHRWRKQLAHFKEIFLGSSPRAQKCRMLNPEMLSFKETGNGGFSARADAGLEIENRALGYKITFFMDRFSVTGAGALSYEGDSQFSDLIPADSAQAKTWRKAREHAFHGSLSHFLRAAAAGTLNESGFLVYALNGLPTPRHTVTRQPVVEDSISAPGDVDHEALLRLPPFMQILYTHTPEPDFYTRIRKSLRRQFGADYIRGPSKTTLYPTSYLEVHSKKLIVHRDGYIYTPQLLTTYGYWAWERMADMLPLDYTPDS